jgi:hypothetical protein
VLGKQERWSNLWLSGEIEAVISPSNDCQDAKHLPNVAAQYSPKMWWQAFFRGTDARAKIPQKSRKFEEIKVRGNFGAGIIFPQLFFFGGGDTQRMEPTREKATTPVEAWRQLGPGPGPGTGRLENFDRHLFRWPR